MVRRTYVLQTKGAEQEANDVKQKTKDNRQKNTVTDDSTDEEGSDDYDSGANSTYDSDYSGSREGNYSEEYDDYPTEVSSWCGVYCINVK